MLVTNLALLALAGSVASRNPSRGRSSRQQPLAGQSDDVSSPESIRERLISNEIIGDVLDDFVPTHYIDPYYAKHDTHVSLGNEIKTKYVKQRPDVTISLIPPETLTDTDESESFGENGKTLTLILTDPDATSRYNPVWSEMCHWIVTNLTSPYSEELQIDQDFEDMYSPRRADLKKHKKHKKYADELEPYLPPGPPPKTGWHRYVFVLLEGDAKPLTVPKERKHWGYGQIRHGVRDWAIENQLTVVGANFFFAKHKKQD